MRAINGTVIGPALLCIGLALLHGYWGTVLGMFGVAGEPDRVAFGAEIIAALSFMAAGVVLIRLLDRIFWKGYVARRSGVAPPGLLVSIVELLVWVAIGTAIFSIVFGRPVAAVLGASGIVLATIGFALRGLIADTFSGIALALERPFNIGDWLAMPPQGNGQVLHMSWRSTMLKLENGTLVSVPNARLADMSIGIYPSPWRDEIDVSLSHDLDTPRAERLLKAAALATPGVLHTPAPDARMLGLTADGVQWRLRFWLPDFPNRAVTRSNVWLSVRHNLRLADIGFAVPIERLQVSPSPPPPPEDVMPAFLARIPLLAPLTAAERDNIASQMDVVDITAGTPVVSQGEAGESLFLVAEGMLQVTISGIEKPVAQMIAGSVFGEMSLLTGEPRSATVTALTDCRLIEVSRTALGPILQQRSELAEAFATLLTERQAVNQRVRVSDEAVASTGPTRASRLAAQVRAFFGLG